MINCDQIIGGNLWQNISECQTVFYALKIS